MKKYRGVSGRDDLLKKNYTLAMASEDAIITINIHSLRLIMIHLRIRFMRLGRHSSLVSVSGHNSAKVGWRSFLFSLFFLFSFFFGFLRRFVVFFWAFFWFPSFVVERERFNQRDG